MKQIADVAALLLIVLMSALSFIAILGVWDFFAGDVIIKAFSTIGLLAGVAFIIIVADRFIGHGNNSEHVVAAGYTPNVTSTNVSVFSAIRRVTLGTLIVSVSLLALLGVLAIWEVLSGEALERSLASIAIIAFVSLINVFVCLEREQSPLLSKGRSFGGGAIMLVLLGFWLLAALLI